MSARSRQARARAAQTARSAGSTQAGCGRNEEKTFLFFFYAPPKVSCRGANEGRSAGCIFRVRGCRCTVQAPRGLFPGAWLTRLARALYDPGLYEVAAEGILTLDPPAPPLPLLPIHLQVDDWGHANVGYHRQPGFNETVTPNIDALVAAGVQLDQH